MNLTIAEKLLLTALDVRENSKTFSAEDLVVRAWQRYPDAFGLAGYSDKYPDSNRVFTNIMGTKGVRGKGWLKKVGEKRYQVTSKALSDGANLIDHISEGSHPSQYLRAELKRETTQSLDRLIGTKAAQKVLGLADGDVSFADACGFWDVTVRSNANTLNVRLTDTAFLLGITKSQVTENQDPVGLRLTRLDLSLEMIEKLIDAHDEFQERFETELAVIKARTDERLNRSRRLK